jgi:hypothetical protein
MVPDAGQKPHGRTYHKRTFFHGVASLHNITISASVTSASGVPVYLDLEDTLRMRDKASFS